MVDFLIQMPLNLLWYPKEAEKDILKRLPDEDWDLIPDGERPTEVKAIENVMKLEGRNILLSYRDKLVMDAERRAMAHKLATTIKIDDTGFVSHEVNDTWLYPRIQQLLASQGIASGIYDIAKCLKRVSSIFEYAEVAGLNVVYVQEPRILRQPLQKAA